MIGNGTTIGNYAIGLGDDTDPRMYEDEEYRGYTIDGLNYDSNTTTFTQSDTQDFLYNSPSYGCSTSPPPSEAMNVEVLQTRKRRKRTELEGNSRASKTGNSQLAIINNLVRSVNKLAQSIDSMDAKEYSC